jgi:MFS superfamily sulfate permease-like transporter
VTAQGRALTLTDPDPDPGHDRRGGRAAGRPRPVDANRELLALGTANVASGLCGAFPVSGSFSRNAVNVRAGGRTRRSGAISAVVVAATLVALTGLLDRLPRAALAGIVVVSVASLVPVRTFRRLRRLQFDDFAYAVVALAGTVALGVLPGLGLAVALSIGGLLYRVTVVDTGVLGYVPEQGTWRRLDRHPGARTVPGVVVLRFPGPLYFANAARLQREIVEQVAEAPPGLHRVVVDARAVSHLDVTAMDVLSELHTELAAEGVDLVLAGLRGPALDAFLRTDLVRAVGRDRVVAPTVRQATGIGRGT